MPSDFSTILYIVNLPASFKSYAKIYFSLGYSAGLSHNLHFGPYLYLINEIHTAIHFTTDLTEPSSNKKSVHLKVRFRRDSDRYNFKLSAFLS